MPVPKSFSQDNTIDPQEYKVKALYLYNLLNFVHWPEATCMVDGSKVNEIAVIGDSPIGTTLKALQAELKKKRNIEINIRFYGPYEDGMDLSGCRLLFITQSEMKNIKKIIARIGDSPILTVSDSEECLDQGCMIALLGRMNKVYWAVNRQPFEKSGLEVSSRVLAMASKVIN